jgi:hypothetical protein
MGPAADELTGQIEACRTAQELAARLPRCAKTLERLVGEAKAETFTQHALGLLEET